MKFHNDFKWNALCQMTPKCNVTDQFAEMLSSPSTCLSVLLNLDVNNKANKQTEPGLEKICLVVTILPEMDVGVSKSHVFLNYSPRALFSQWDTHLHGGAVCSLLPMLFTVGLPPVHSVSVWELTFKELENWCSVINKIAGGRPTSVFIVCSSFWCITSGSRGCCSLAKRCVCLYGI